MNDKQLPDRIYDWLYTQLSVARYFGGITLNGTRYVVAHDEPGLPLVRWDVFKQKAKDKAKEKPITGTQGELL
jgi:hypothetical protein